MKSFWHKGTAQRTCHMTKLISKDRSLDRTYHKVITLEPRLPVYYKLTLWLLTISGDKDMREQWGHLWKMCICGTSFLLTYKGIGRHQCKGSWRQSWGTKQLLWPAPLTEKPAVISKAVPGWRVWALCPLITCKFLMKILDKIQRGGYDESLSHGVHFSVPL